MKFKECRKFLGSKIEEVSGFLSFDLNTALKDLFTGLGKLDFVSNFDQFTETNLIITAGSEQAIRNKLNAIPSGYIVLKNTNGNVIADGTTAWTKDYVYVRNLGGVPAIITIMFVR